MSISVRDIESRLVAVRTVGSIVRAMLALAQAQLPEADAAAAQATEYVDELDRVIGRLAVPVAREARARLTVVLGPERSMCGGLPRRVASVAAEQAGDLGLVGRRMQDSYEGLGVRFAIGGPTSIADLADSTRALATEVLAHGRERDVHIVHPRQGATELHRAVLLGSWALRREPPPTFAPPQTVLERVVREVTLARLQVALAETLRVEIAARALAAEVAGHAVRRKEDALRVTQRVARHEQITDEILDITRARGVSQR